MNLTEQKLYKFLDFEEFKKPYQRIIEEFANLSAAEDAKITIKKIRSVYPVLEFESSKFPEFKELLKKFRSNINKTLKDAGEVWLFVHEGPGYIKKSDSFRSLTNNYIPATISPLPGDQFVYRSVLIKEDIAKKLRLSDHCNFVELKSVKITAYAPDEFLIYIDDVEKKDIYDILNFYKNFADDRSKDYKSIIRELSDNTKIADDLGASTLSAFNGISYSVASKYKGAIEANIKGTYEGLQILLPPLFRRDEFSLNFNPNSPNTTMFYRNKKLTVKCVPIPVYDFDQDHLYLKSYKKTRPNQTWAASINTPAGDYGITSILNLFQTANYVTNIKEYPEPYDLSCLHKDSAILDEEIWLWLVARRNFRVNLSENSKTYFNNRFSGTINELFGEILPESCIKDAAAGSLVTDGFKRSYEDFCRFGTYKNSEDDAKEFGNNYLKNIEAFIRSAEGRDPNLKKLAEEQKKRISKKSGESEQKGNRSRIVNSVIDMTSIAKEIPYDKLISSIAGGFGYEMKDVKESVDWMIKEWGNKKQGWLKIMDVNGEKIVVRKIPGIERI